MLPQRELIIQSRRPARRAAGLVLLVGLFVGIAYAAYMRGGSDAHSAYSRAAIERGEALASARLLDESNAWLRERVAILERAAQVDTQAYGEVAASLKQLQDRVLDLEEEVAFYRGVIADRRQERDLDIHDFKLLRDDEAHAYRYKLVLTRVGKSDKVMQGTIRLVVTGTQGGGAEQGRAQQASEHAQDDIGFRFNYFHRMEGRLTLPEGFVPSRMSITVTLSGQRQPRIEKTFDWTDLLG